MARLVRDLRDAGRAEWTIAGIIGAARQVFRYAQQRLSWAGSSPTSLLGAGERPKTSATSRRRIYRGDELPQTLAAAGEPFRTLFAVAAVTGARLSELLGLTWEDVGLDDLDEAEIRFEAQADRKGLRQPLKTQESRRTVEIPPQLAAMLLRHKLASGAAAPAAAVFATRSGRPLGQRNVMRALRQAQERATDHTGRPTFPQLHVVDEAGCRVKPPAGSVPSFHGFRHSAASEAIAAGDSAEEVSWQLGHKSSLVTRAVYVQEIRTAERTARRRARMAARYGSALEAVDRSRPPNTKAP